jgi:hypothetical protein
MSWGVVGHYTYPSYIANKTAITGGLISLAPYYGRTRLYTGASGDAQRDWMEELHDANGMVFNVVMGTPIIADTPSDLVAYAKTFNPGVITSMEGGNEWNLKGRPNWVTEIRGHQQALWNAVHHATLGIPGMTVVQAALGLRKDYDLMGDMSAWCDVGNSHCYPGGLQPSVRIVEAKDNTMTINAPGKTRSWFTETGYATPIDLHAAPYYTHETPQGWYMPKLIMEHYLNGDERTYFYEYFDEGTNTADAEDFYGIVRNNTNKKPAWFALQRFQQKLRDHGHESYSPPNLICEVTGGDANLKYVLCRKFNGGKPVVVFWRDIQSWDRDAQVIQPHTAQNIVFKTATTYNFTATQLDDGATTTATGTQITFPLADDIVILEADALTSSIVGSAKLGDGATTTTTAVTGTLPGGSSINDMIYLALTHNDTTATIPSLGAWTQVSTGELVAATLRQTILRRPVTSGDITAGTVTSPAWSAAGRVVGVMYVIHGLAATPNETAPSPTIVASTGTGTSPVVTTTVDGSPVLVFTATRLAAKADPNAPAAYTDDQASMTNFGTGANIVEDGMHLTTPGAAGNYGGDSITTTPTAAGMIIHTIGLIPDAPTTGTVTGAVTYSGATMSGQRTPKASATGAVGWVGTITGKRTPKGSATGNITWVGSMAGSPSHIGSIGGTVIWGTSSFPGITTRRGSVTGAVTRGPGVFDGEEPIIPFTAVFKDNEGDLDPATSLVYWDGTTSHPITGVAVAE